MDIKIITKNTSVRENFKEKAAKKLAKFDRFFGDDASAIITVINQNDRETVEITVKAGGMFFRAERTTADRLDSLEAATDALAKQIVRNKKKLIKKFQNAPAEIPFEDEAVEPEEEDEAKEEYGIVRTKRFAVNSMDPQEAILQMNMLGHSFFMFRDATTDEINLVYRRDDGNYGLLIPED